MSSDLLWADLTAEDTESLVGLHGDPETQYSTLGDTLGFKHYADDDRERIVLDFLFHNLRFAHDNGFTPEQSSTFFSIMKSLLDQARATRLESGEWPGLADSFGQFKQMVLHHSFTGGDSPSAVQVFSKDNVQALTGFVTQSFFRHYNAYKVVFTREQDVEAVTRRVVVETPLCPPPLAEATEDGEDGAVSDGMAGDGDGGGDSVGEGGEEDDAEA